MMPKVLSLVATLGLLVACTTTAPVKEETSHHSRVVPGSQFVLNEPLEVYEGHARAYIQFGKAMPKKDLEIYQPHCQFEVKWVSQGNRFIEPDTFTVTSLYEDEEEVVHLSAPIKVAALDLEGAEGSIVLLSRYIRHGLTSEKQPTVMNITCHSGLSEGWQLKYPSVSEIRQTLGNIVTVRLANR